MSDGMVSVENQHNGTIVFKENEPPRQNVIEGIRLRCLEMAGRELRFSRDEQLTSAVIAQAHAFEQYVINGYQPEESA